MGSTGASLTERLWALPWDTDEPGKGGSAWGLLGFTTVPNRLEGKSKALE